MIFIPVGFYYCLNHKVTYGKLFLGLYGVLSTYFSCVMIRLMLVVAPAACVLAAIGISEILRKMAKSIRLWLEAGSEEVESKNDDKKAPQKKAGGKDDKGKKGVRKVRVPPDVAVVVMLFFIVFL